MNAAKAALNSQVRRHLTIGITGGIGSGKSVLCSLFTGLGRITINADEAAKRIADEDVMARTAIVREFGREAYLPNGKLDRKRIASIVFNDEMKMMILNSIVHPLVLKEIEYQLDVISPLQAPPYVLVEAALIFESGMEHSLDHVVVVAADEETCVQRVMVRDKISREEVRKRIASQMPQSKKEKLADFVVHNNSSVPDLHSSVKFLDSIFQQLQLARVT